MSEELKARLAELEEQQAMLVDALADMVECTETPPDGNCSCHISPPCQDCTEYGYVRYALRVARAALAAVKPAGQEGEVS